MNTGSMGITRLGRPLFYSREPLELNDLKFETYLAFDIVSRLKHDICQEFSLVRSDWQNQKSL